MREKKYRFLQATFAFVFIFITVAAGHLLMVVINRVDESISADLYSKAVQPARWFGDTTVQEELLEEAEKYERKGDAESASLLRSAVEDVERTGELRFFMLPVSPFLAWMMGALIVGALLSICLTRLTSNDGVQTVLGIFGGLLLWTGAVEYGLMIASRQLGISKGIGVHAGQIVGKFGEYVLLKHTWGLLVVVVAFLFFMEGVRCNLFLYFRKSMKLMRGKPITGTVDNYGPRVAFMYSTVMWFFYVLLVIAYDPAIFGPHSWFTYAVFFLSFSITLYLFLKLSQQRTFAAAVRYAIPTAMVFWNDVEIMAKWGFFNEPWLILEPINAAVFFGGLAIGTWLTVRGVMRDRAESA